MIDAMVTLRAMRTADLSLVRQWLAQPHVATWFLVGSSLEEELEDIRRSVAGELGTEVLLVLDEGEPVGWCQWYLCGVDPDWADDVGAGPGDTGIDYAIGVADRVGRGIGTELVTALVNRVRTSRPNCAIVSDPDARNVASRRVLEKNGFVLQRVGSLASEPTDDPMAIYRLVGPAPARTTTS